MARLAEQISLNQKQAAATQQALRNNRRVIRRVEPEPEAESEPEPEADGDERSAIVLLKKSVASPTALVAISDAHALPTANPHTAITLSPLDLPTEQFSAGLDRRKQNRQLLMDWLRTALVEGADYGRIHVVSVIVASSHALAA